jgi:hypothetical protein
MTAIREKVILAGDDAQLVPLFERLRAGDLAEVVALGSADPASLTAILAAVGGLPLISPTGTEASPPADLWICSADWQVRAGQAPCLDFEAASTHWPPAGSAGLRAPAANAAAAPPAVPAAPDPALRDQAATALAGAPFAAFARELQREIQRSQRYHLGFTLSILRIVDAAGQALPERAFLLEPLRSLPARVGRACDSWGLSREGYLLHLAPETLEQASALRRRLEAAMLEAMVAQPGGPWRVETGQARFPRDGEQGKVLVDLALQRLLRRLAHGEADS